MILLIYLIKIKILKTWLWTYVLQNEFIQRINSIWSFFFKNELRDLTNTLINHKSIKPFLLSYQIVFPIILDSCSDIPVSNFISRKPSFKTRKLSKAAFTAALVGPPILKDLRDLGVAMEVLMELLTLEALPLHLGSVR